ncbi:MAG: M16 family metallopeptidase [Patescibacteria group bacterium]
MEKHIISQKRLKNGSNLIHIKISNWPLSLISVWFKTGSRYDPIKKEGLAHFVEHLFFKKTKNYNTPQKKFKEIESLGIELNAYTTKENTVYYHSQIKESTEKSISLLLDSLKNHLITAKDVESEKKVILDELNRDYQDSDSYIYTLAEANLWPQDPIGRNILGTKDSINKITFKDVKDFIKNNYSQAPDFLFIGDMELTEVINILNKENLIFKNPTKEKINETVSSPKLILINKRPENHLTISISFQTVSIKNTSENIKLHLLMAYLANGWISKLIDSLRVKHNLSYWVNGQMVALSDRGYIQFVFNVDKKELNRSLKLIFSEIKKLKQINIVKDDIEAHKSSLISSIRHTNITPSALMWWYGWDMSLNGKSETPSSYINKIKNLDFSDIKEVAKKYFKKDNLSISIIGNVSKKEVGDIIAKIKF